MKMPPTNRYTCKYTIANMSAYITEYTFFFFLIGEKAVTQNTDDLKVQ